MVRDLTWRMARPQRDVSGCRFYFCRSAARAALRMLRIRVVALVAPVLIDPVAVVPLQRE